MHLMQNRESEGGSNGLDLVGIELEVLGYSFGNLIEFDFRVGSLKATVSETKEVKQFFELLT